MGAFSGTGIINDSFGSGSDNSFNAGNYLLGTENLIANTFLANQAITSPRPATVQLAPNGTVIASGGGANSPIAGGSSWGALFSNPLVLVLILLFAFLIFKH